MNNEIVILAANVLEPAMDGGSLRSLAFYREFQRNGLSPIWLGRGSTSLPDYQTLRPPKGKLVAGFRALSMGEHYQVARHIGADWRGAVKNAASLVGAKVPLWCNFVWTYPEWTNKKSEMVFIDTHNAEREWYETLADQTRNPLKRRVALQSIEIAERIVRALPSSTTLVHVSKRDEEYYQKLAPHCRHTVVPNGCVPRPMRVLPRRAGVPRLYFLGSLGVQMNHDALSHFAQIFWPALRTVSQFTVYGSNPTASIERLCAAHDWSLRSNLPDLKLDEELSHCDVAVLPFAYAAGSKLKLADALMRGMHVLATPEAVRGIEGLPMNVKIGSRGSDWQQALSVMDISKVSASQESVAYAKAFTWRKIIGAFLAGPYSPLHTLS